MMGLVPFLSPSVKDNPLNPPSQWDGRPAPPLIRGEGGFSPPSLLAGTPVPKNRLDRNFFVDIFNAC